ncbi:MAG: hypothetical protein WD468_09430 [Pirellulales bacterium]
MNSISRKYSGAAPLPRRLYTVVLLGATMSVAVSEVLRAQPAANEPGEAVEFCLGPNLFVDDYLIAESTGLTRTMHPPEKVLDPVIHYDLPMLYMTVLYDPDLGRYRMWYNCSRRHRNEGNGHNYTTGYAYAESKDGIKWQLPQLGLVAFPGEKDNSLTKYPTTHPYSNNFFDAPLGHFALFFVDDGPECPEPSRRYKMAYFKSGKTKGTGENGMRVAFSADGMHFKDYGGNPVLPQYEKDGSNVISDAIEGCWDPLKNQYIAGCKIWGTGYPGKVRNGPEAGWRRVAGITTSKDFIHWEKPKIVLTPNRNEGLEEFNMLKVKVVGNLYLGFLRVLRDDLAATPGMPVGGTGTTELASSRDGLSWVRHPGKFIDRSPIEGRWDHAMAYYADSITVGDKEYIYYSGYAEGHKTFYDRKVGMALLRKNGYVSRDTASAGGMLKTPLAKLPGDYFTVNANVGEELRVRLVTAQGQTVPGFDWADYVPIRGDSVSHRVEWRDSPELPRDELVSIEFSLKGPTELYGFDFAQVGPAKHPTALKPVTENTLPKE